MAKVKNKRSKIQKPTRAKSEVKFKPNPFELHINKEKLKVLGRKQQKHVRGQPGVSRSKALEKRKHTLLQEYKVFNKSNKFSDLRIGEKDPNMPDEHRFTARFAAEKIKSHSKKSIFNLADDEVLTHKGQLLTEIEKFENEASDDDTDDDKELHSEFVKDAHFGGGILQRVSSDGAKSHKDLINQLILESKKRKNERLKMKEQTLELTEKLDSEWKDLLPLVSKNKRTNSEPDAEPKPKHDDYDKVMRELKFEARGNPSDRLKSEEEIAAQEKEELARFEEERAKRMQGADDLDDNFDLDDDFNQLENDKEENDVESLNESHDDEDDDANKEVDSDEEEEQEHSAEEEEEENSAEEIEEVEEMLDSEDDNISLSDLKVQELSESSSSEEEIDDDGNEEDGHVKPDEMNTDTLLQPTFPTSYECLEELFESHMPEKLGTVLSQIIQLVEGKKEKIMVLFTLLLEYIDSSFCTFKKLTYLMPSLFDIARINPQYVFTSVVQMLKEKHETYRQNVKKFPSIHLLFVLKLISCLFPTSDFRNGVVTPAFIFISQLLTTCKVRNKRDISYGLFLVTLVIEYTALSKRLLPAAVNFLSGIVHMAIPKSGVGLIKIPPPFKSTCTLLVLQENMNSIKADLRLKEIDLCKVEKCDPMFQICALSVALKLLQEMMAHLNELPSSCEIFAQAAKFSARIPVDKYPKNVQKDINALRHCLLQNACNKKLEYIIAPMKKPKLLRLYEPNIEKVYDGKKHKGKSREKMEMDKLMHKIKRETKGALREIRRDKSFLAKVKINKKIQNDTERRAKVKRIYSEAAMQQAELNSMDRKKKRA